MVSQTKFTFELPVLRLLENEHQYLTYLMNQWHPMVLEIEQDRYTLKEARIVLEKLRKQMIQFLDPLKNHTEKEESYLFPALAKYIGNEQGPILAVEEEHQEIDAYIGHFLHHTRGDLQQFSMHDIKDVVRDAGEAFETITIHFIKEQSIVFPMVKDILQKEEQDRLLHQLYSPIVDLKDLL